MPSAKSRRMPARTIVVKNGRGVKSPSLPSFFPLLSASSWILFLIASTWSSEIWQTLAYRCPWNKYGKGEMSTFWRVHLKLSTFFSGLTNDSHKRTVVIVWWVVVCHFDKWHEFSCFFMRAFLGNTRRDKIISAIPKAALMYILVLWKIDCDLIIVFHSSFIPFGAQFPIWSPAEEV